MNTMPWAARADLMVRRGEARNFSEACSLMAKRRRRKTSQPKPQMAMPVRTWSPYKDD